jgi:hypothetical protein
MFSNRAARSVDPGWLGARTLGGTRVFTRMCIRRSLELRLSYPPTGLNTHGSGVGRGEGIIASQKHGASEVRIDYGP